MTTISNRIYLLDDISQAKIKHSVQITSLTDVVLELVKNALDAHAENIKITLNYAHGFCSILDDGHGIPAHEFESDGGLGKPFHTSKLGRVHETYGRNGRYLAALSGMSLLSVASRVNSSDSHVLWLDQSGRLRHAREPPDAIECETGTRVKVYGLFSKLPVRSKSLLDRFASPSEVQKEFEKLKIGIIGLVLAAPKPFNARVEHSSPKHVYRYKPSMEQTASLSLSHHKSLSCVNSAIRQAGHADTSQLCQWQEMAIQSGGITLHGLISTLPMPHKMVQYISLNHLPVTRQAQPELFHAINLLFAQSTFGSTPSADIAELADSHHKRRLRSHAKEVDKWPMFVIWVDTKSDSIHELVCDAVVSPRAQKLLGRITSLMQSLIEEFLVAHDYTKPQRERALQTFQTATDTSVSQTVPADKRRDRSKDSFRHWSRVRSSRVSVMDNILAGLPFHDKPEADHKDVLLATKGSQSSAGQFNAIEVADGMEVPTTSTSVKEKVNEQGCVHWTDPQTGRVLQLDSRTGMELPSYSVLSNTGTKNDVNQELAAYNHTRLSNLNTSPRDEDTEPSLAEVARNVSKYSRGLAPRQDQAIRLIGFFTHLDEDFEQHRSTATNLKAESFWASIERCSSHHSVQRETPSISIKALRFAKVVRQINREFILVLIQDQGLDHGPYHSRSEQLVLIDQHAADERCKVEALLKSVYEDEPIRLSAQIIFGISKTESDLLLSASAYFAQWKILYELSEKQRGNSERTIRQVRVTSLPPAIAERCRLNPEFIINILREEIYSDRRSDQYTKNTQTTRPRSIFDLPIPPRLLEMINSRACRSAIMFNDKLSIEQCEAIIKQLSNCTLPFQCAHGRPSMVVLTDIADLSENRPLAPRLRKTSTYFNINNKIASRTDNARPANAHTMSDSCNNNDQSDQVGHVTNHRWTQRPYSRADITLNTIENNPITFGEAYNFWITSQKPT